jgi:hypothetical protein
MKRSFWQSFRITSVSFIALLLCVQLGFAQVMSSSNYQLQSDSVNFGGGLSSSTNYVQESTFGEIATGNSSSTNYQLRAGYQQMQEVYLSLSSPADVLMRPSISGITGGTSNGSTTVKVTTDSPAGYSLSMKAANNPAMQSGASSIPDHDTTISYNFNLPPSTARFGYAIYGPDTAAAFLHTGSTCGTGSSNTIQQCWRGFTTSEYVVAQSTDANHPSGTDTVLYFRVGVSAGSSVQDGVYTATTTLTALPL